MPFFALFIAVPFIEILIFMAVGDQVGFLNTLFLAFLTAVIGGLIVQQQGLQTILAIKNALHHGNLPLREFFDGLCLVAAGAMLITPGFLTDVIGFSLLVPAVRAIIRKLIASHTTWFMTGGDPDMSAQQQPHHQHGAGDIIDAEFEEIPPKNKR